MTSMHPPEHPNDSVPRNPNDPFEDFGEPDAEEINFATLAHLSGCAGLIGFGYIGFIGPLLIYWIKQDSSPYVKSQAKEAFNFQITIFLIALTCGMLTILSCGTMFPIIFLPMLLQLIFGILSTAAVRKSQAYRYPFNLRLLL